ncbi:MAG: pyridoxamine 5'-phosphate oxidase family protein, partial [Alphaproteobacteria bacterium]|nr:pyridoxamine 5'-phosphate oxidase family protein [Alphaproteobacteria bacterium]
MPDDVKLDSFDITRRDRLRAVYKMPGEGAVKKVLPALDRHCRAFVEKSPFCVLATCDADGNLDASPKGGPPGWVKIANDKTVMLPDWPGNNRLDGLENIIVNPGVGLLFFLPGMTEMLRLNGRARITTDPALKRKFETDGHLPVSIIVVAIDDVYLHCSRALQRSALWDASRQIDRKRDFPSMGQMLADQVKGYDADAVDRLIEANKDNLYG